MSRFRVLICRVDDDDTDKMVEIDAIDVPGDPIDTLCPRTALDDLEQQTFEFGNTMLRKLMQARWEQLDTQLTQKARQDFPPSAHQKRRKQAP